MCKKNFNKYIGEKYNHLTILKAFPRTGSKTILLCQCDCGNKAFIQAGNVLDGHTTSCGCIQKQTCVKNGKNSKRHGFVGHPLYFVHQSMIARCERSTHEAYPNYGGRGIKVCKEWHDMKTFGEWALSHGYKRGLSIDRIDNDGNYEPSNCRWVTMKIQASNRRTCLNYKSARAEAEDAMKRSRKC